MDASWFVYNMIRLGAIKQSGHDICLNICNIVSVPKLYDDLLRVINITPDTFANIDLICGVSYTSIPFATFLSYKTNIPMIMLDNKSLDKCRVETNVLLVEDMLSKASTEALDILQSYNLKVVKCLALVSKEDTVYSLPKMRILFKLDFIKYIVEGLANNQLSMYQNSISNIIFNTMLWKNTNIILSFDTCTTAQIRHQVDALHPNIIGILLHSDIIDLDKNFVQWLIYIKRAYNIFVIDDRKLSDKYNICTAKLNRLSSWVDAVTAHCIEETFEAIKNSGIAIIPLSVGEQDNTLLSKYKSSIAGVYTLKDTYKCNYLTMTPDVTLTRSTDSYKAICADTGLLWIIGSEHPDDNINIYRTVGMKHASSWGL